jgi:hypothetical protein
MKPIEYRLELCDTSGQHRPIAIVTAASPFMPVSVGDRFDDGRQARHRRQPLQVQRRVEVGRDVRRHPGEPPGLELGCRGTSHARSLAAIA